MNGKNLRLHATRKFHRYHRPTTNNISSKFLTDACGRALRWSRMKRPSTHINLLLPVCSPLKSVTHIFFSFQFHRDLYITNRWHTYTHIFYPAILLGVKRKKIYRRVSYVRWSATKIQMESRKPQLDTSISFLAINYWKFIERSYERVGPSGNRSGPY